MSDTTSEVHQPEAESTEKSTERRYKFTLFPDNKNSVGKPAKATWAEFAIWIERLGAKPAPEKKGDLALWCPTIFAGNHRKKEKAKKIGLLAIDIDNEVKPKEYEKLPEPRPEVIEVTKPGAKTPTNKLVHPNTPEQVLGVLPGKACVWHTSFSHSAEWPKYRFCWGLSRDVTSEEYVRIWGVLEKRFRAAGVFLDQVTDDASRGWFVPAKTELFEHGSVEGDVLDVDLILEQAPVPEEKTSPKKAKASSSKEQEPGDEVWEKCNAVPVSQVYRELGLGDPEHPSCPSCGHDADGSDTSVACLDLKGGDQPNVIKCQHATCGGATYGSVRLVGKVVAGVEKIKGDKEAVRKVLGWFAEHGHIPPLGKRRKAPKADAPDASAGEWTTDERPVVRISVEEKQVNDEAIEALARSGSGLYQRGRALVKVMDGAIHTIAQPTLRETLSHVIRWERWDEKKEDYVHASPPGSAVSAVYCRGDWGLPPIRGVVEGPCLRADGTVITKPGYDPASGVYVRGTVSVDVPEQPTQKDAQSAWAKLEDVLADFPFTEDIDRAAALSLLLTPGVRATLDGPAPFQLIRATTPGTGKDLLANIAGVIWTGSTPPVVPPISGNPDEVRKRFLPLVMAGRPFALFDDLSHFGDPTWAANLTLTVLEDRVLGESRIVSAPIVTTFVGTGNNTSVYGDCLRRVVVTQMQSPFEDPENRPLESFRYPDRAFKLLPYVKARRAELLSACLTILRAYQVAGCPDHPTWGSYEEWARVVAGAVTWLGLPNPCTSADRLSSDAVTDRSQLGVLFEAWEACFGSGPQTAAQILAECKMSTGLDDGAARLHYAVMQLCNSKDDKLPSALVLGKRLAKFRGRVVEGRRLVAGKDGHTKTTTWSVVEASPASPAEIGGENAGMRVIAGDGFSTITRNGAAKNGCQMHFAGDAGDDFKSMGEMESTTHHSDATGGSESDHIPSQICMDPGSSPAITRNEAQLVEIIDERLRVMGLTNTRTSPAITRIHESPATSAGDAGVAGDPSPATTEHLPPPIPFDQVVASQAAAQAAAQAQAEREAIAHQYLAMCERAQQQQSPPPPPPEFPEDVGGTPTPEQLAYRRQLRGYAQICANLERMYGNG